MKRQYRRRRKYYRRSGLGLGRAVRAAWHSEPARFTRYVTKNSIGWGVHMAFKGTFRLARGIFRMFG